MTDNGPTIASLNVEDAINDLKRQDDVLKRECGEIQNGISTLSAEMLVTMPMHIYREKAQRKAKLKARLEAMIRRRDPIKARIRELSVERERVKLCDKSDGSRIVGLVVQLREKYNAMASDGTRTEAVRFMSNQFADDLNALMKKLYVEAE